jgi:hypothetical protein
VLLGPLLGRLVARRRVAAPVGEERPREPVGSP